MSRRLTLIAAVISLVIFTAAQSLLINFDKSIFSLKPSLSEKPSSPVPISVPKIFGISTDSLDIVEGVVSSGETISTLLNDFNIAPATVKELTRKAKPVFEVRKIRANHPYTLLHTKDTNRTARYLIYEPNDLEYVIYDLRDSLSVSLHERETEIVERELYGEIHGSLYQSIIDAGGSAQLIDDMADIYSWRLDLNHLQAGDMFKLIFEERQVNGKTIEIGQLKAAYIEDNGEPIYAIGFDQGDGLSYYDQDGQSLKKAFLKEPVEYSRVSSRYTKSRFHPVQKLFKAHLGTDFAAPTGTPIRTVGDGVVLEAGRAGGNGNYVKIRHNQTYTTQYLHMSKFAKGIRRGVRVKMGQTIGYVGSTGLSTGPHLCYRFWKNGQQVDALKEKLPQAEPVEKHYLTAFMSVREKIVGRMEAMNASDLNKEMLASKRFENNNSSI